jgi:hypothetical protein
VSEALVIQYATGMRHYILSSVACPAVRYYLTVSPKRYVFRAGVTEHKMCVSIFSTFSETLLILTRIQRGIIINVHTGLQVKYPVTIVRL